jgi:hypothetical protein
MVNDFLTKPSRSLKLYPWLAFLLMVTLAVPTAESAPKYKKNTVVDFEGALVEGKSRKPYSAYLTQQKDSIFGELHQWQPDLDRTLLESQRRMDKSL